MKGNPEVIALLQRAVCGESLAHNQYICDAETLDRIGLSNLAAKMRAEAGEEKAHLERYCRRMVFLDEDPKIIADSTQGFSSISDMLRNQLRLEMDAVALYTDGCGVSLGAKDFATYDIFLRTLADEEDHVRFLEGQLHLIEVMGEADYIQSYVALPE